MKMNIFNRRDLFITRRLNDLVRVEENLEKNGIKYQVKPGNLINHGKYRGVPGIRMEYAYEYRVYVHKNDYDRAKHVIGL